VHKVAEATDFKALAERAAGRARPPVQPALLGSVSSGLRSSVAALRLALRRPCRAARRRACGAHARHRAHWDWRGTVLDIWPALGRGCGLGLAQSSAPFSCVREAAREAVRVSSVARRAARPTQGTVHAGALAPATAARPRPLAVPAEDASERGPPVATAARHAQAGATCSALPYPNPNPTLARRRARRVRRPQQLRQARRGRGAPVGRAAGGERAAVPAGGHGRRAPRVPVHAGVPP